MTVCITLATAMIFISDPHWFNAFVLWFNVGNLIVIASRYMLIHDGHISIYRIFQTTILWPLAALELYGYWKASKPYDTKNQYLLLVAKKDLPKLPRYVHRFIVGYAIKKPQTESRLDA